MSNSGPRPVPVEIPKEAEKGKPSKTLPTERIQPPKQLEILRAYAAASGAGAKPATINEVAEIVGMASSTVSMANAFLANVGLLQRTDVGSYLPSADVISFFRAYEWRPDIAAHKLATAFKGAWFANAVLPRLAFSPIDEDTAIGLLAEAAAAGPEYRRELRMLIDFLALSGLLQRDGNLLRSRKSDSPTQPEQPPVNGDSPKGERHEETPLSKNARVFTSFNQSTEGAINFNVSVRVDMAEFAGWRADRIAAFFNGIAQVLAAKADIESGSAKEGA